MARILLALALPLGVAGAAYGEIAQDGDGFLWAVPFGNMTEECGFITGFPESDEDDTFRFDGTKAGCFTYCEGMDSGAAFFANYQAADPSDPYIGACWYDFPRALHSCAHVCVCACAHARAHSPSPRPRCPLQLPGFRPKVGPKPWLAEAMVLG